MEKLTRLIARREIYVETHWTEASIRWMRFQASRLERSTVLDEFLTRPEGVEVPTLPNAVNDLYRRIDHFWEFGEETMSPTGEVLEGAAEEAWLDEHMKIFEAVGAAVRSIGLASIASLRSDDGYTSVKELEVALDLHAPRNLGAGVDDQLSRLLLDHWTNQATSGHFGDTPALSILSLSINWTIDIKLERWPPPWV